MLTLFRLNDPFRLIGVALLAALIRLPFWLGEIPLTEPEVKWMLLGEQLANGRQLYGEIWSSISPLSGAVYWICFELFGKNRWLYILVALILSIYQAGIFNYLLIRKNVYNEKTYIPALLYIVFQASSVDFLILSPALIALTFVLRMLKSILELGDHGKDQDIFKVGLFLGISSLFHFPTFAFLAVVVWGVGSFRVIAFRQLMLILFGIAIVWAGISIYYLFLGIFPDFYINYILANVSLSNIAYASWQDILWFQALPVALAIWGFFRVIGERGFVNFQASCQRIMFIWILSSSVSLLIAPQFAVYQLITMIPAVAFFVSHAYLLYQRKWLMELTFAITAVVVISLSYGNGLISQWIKLEKPNQQLFIEKPSWEVKGEPIWVLGNNPSYYLNNRLATPFLNWKLTEQYLGSLDNYNVVTNIYQYIEDNPPTFIIDEAGKVPELFRKVPLLKEKYENTANNSFIYKRKVSTPSSSSPESN